MSSTMRLTLFIKPSRNRTELICESDGTLTMHVTAPPVKGKANREIIKWISKRIGKPSSHVRLIAGAHSQTKVLEILAADYDKVVAALGINSATSAVQLR